MDTINAAVESPLQPKAHLTGKVIKTTLAGAILDIGQKIPGVVHISQLSKEAVNRVEDVVKTGQSVDVWVRRVRDDRVELTMIQPLALEWKEILPEMHVKGKVVRLESYGAFIDIGAERPGMVHVSEISNGYVRNPSEVLKEGDEVEAVVLNVDRRKRQIRLSIKAALPQEEQSGTEEPEAVQPRKRRDRNPRKKEEQMEEPQETEIELTSFQMAFEKAQKRAVGKNKPSSGKKARIQPQESEEILERTLKNRITDK